MTSTSAAVTKTVLLVDDHDLIRQGLSRAFERSHEFSVCGQAGTVRDGVRLALELSPSVVVTDVRLPDGTGLDLVRRLRQQYHQMGLVVLTMYGGDDQLFEAMEAGASAFIGKEVPADEVVAAARHAHVSPQIFTATNLVEAMQRRMTPSAPRLSAREEEVLALLAQGLAVSAIAKSLYVSESTTKTHISKIYEKLGAANRAQAIMNAVRSGLLSDI